MENDKLPRIHVSTLSYGKGNGAGCSVTIENLTRQELEWVEAAILGVKHLAFNSGRMEASDRHRPLPTPTDDPPMQGFWTRKWKEPLQIPDRPYPPPQMLEFSDRESRYPHIVIQGLHTSYAIQVRLLESYGFFCLRSRRGDCGRFWEIWYLPSLITAAGDLKVAIDLVQPGDQQHETRRQAAAIDFLCKHVYFNTLDLSCQRACIVFD